MENTNATIGSITYIKLNDDIYLMCSNRVHTNLSGKKNINI